MRAIFASTLAGAVALLLVAAPSAFASTLSVTAPDTIQQEQSFPVHVSGTADEFELAWTAFVQNEPCPATFQEAQAQPDAVRENNTQLQKGPFDFNSTLSSVVGRPPGRVLTGTANVCSYLYHEFTSDQSTVATAVNVITIKSKPTSPFQFFGHMSSAGSIRVATTCPKGCNAKVVYTSAVSNKSRTVTKHLQSSAAPASIELKLDKKTAALVRKIRKKGHGGPVKVTVHATATPPSGPPLKATRVVKVT
jgi:hypothetical protein